MSEATFHRLDHPGVMARLREYVRAELAPRPEVVEVVLIGSLSRGDWAARSDADLVIVVDQASAPGPFRGSEYLPAENVGVSVDIFVYTPEEAAGWRPRFRGEVESGTVLYRRPAASPS